MYVPALYYYRIFVIVVYIINIIIITVVGPSHRFFPSDKRLRMRKFYSHKEASSILFN